MNGNGTFDKVSQPGATLVRRCHDERYYFTSDSYVVYQTKLNYVDIGRIQLGIFAVLECIPNQALIDRCVPRFAESREPGRLLHNTITADCNRKWMGRRDQRIHHSFAERFNLFLTRAACERNGYIGIFCLKTAPAGTRLIGNG